MLLSVFFPFLLEQIQHMITVLRFVAVERVICAKGERLILSTDRKYSDEKLFF